MSALAIALLLLALLFFGLGFAVKALFWVALVVIVLAALSFFFNGRSRL